MAGGTGGPGVTGDKPEKRTRVAENVRRVERKCGAEVWKKVRKWGGGSGSGEAVVEVGRWERKCGGRSGSAEAGVEVRRRERKFGGGSGCAEAGVDVWRTEWMCRKRSGCVENKWLG
jgi:hypothetical protein